MELRRLVARPADLVIPVELLAEDIFPEVLEPANNLIMTWPIGTFSWGDKPCLHLETN